MQLSREAVEEIKVEIGKAIDAQPRDFTPAGISIADLCANKALIIGFLNTLVGLLPGIAGKIAGQVVVSAAEGWFAKKCG